MRASLLEGAKTSGGMSKAKMEQKIKKAGEESDGRNQL